jgi:hypothetical protein
VIVIVERARIADDAGARPVRVMVLLDAPYEDAAITFDAASGEVLGERRTPFVIPWRPAAGREVASPHP